MQTAHMAVLRPFARSTHVHLFATLVVVDEGVWTSYVNSAAGEEYPCPSWDIGHICRLCGSEDMIVIVVDQSIRLPHANGCFSTFWCRQLKEQLLLGFEVRERGSILEAVTLAGWLSRGPQLQPAVLELLDSAWDELEKGLDGRVLVSGRSTRHKYIATQCIHKLLGEEQICPALHMPRPQAPCFLSLSERGASQQPVFLGGNITPGLRVFAA